MSYPLDPEETINMLAEKIGKWADGKGFWDDWKLAQILDSFAADMMLLTHDVDGQEMSVGRVLTQAATALRNNVVGTKLMLIVSEASEALETLRDHGVNQILAGEGNMGEELADIEIRVKDLAFMLGKDLGAEEMAKINRNNDRPHKHGRQL